MTTLIYNASAVPALRTEAELEISKATAPERTKLRHTLASRLAVLTICVMIVLTTMAYGAVHYWALAVFAATAAGMVCLWCLDGLVLRSVRLSKNLLQLPLIGMILLGLIQLLPMRQAADN